MTLKTVDDQSEIRIPLCYDKIITITKYSSRGSFKMGDVFSVFVELTDLFILIGIKIIY